MVCSNQIHTLFLLMHIYLQSLLAINPYESCLEEAIYETLFLELVL